MTAAHQNAPGDESAAFESWFQSQQGTAYDDAWSFARAAWMERAALNARPQPAQVDSLLGFPIVIDDKLPPYQVRVVSGGRTHLFTLDMDAGTATPTPPPTSASPQVGGHPELLRIIMDEDYPYLAHDPTKGQAERRALLAAIAALTQPPAVSAEWVVDDAMIRRFVDAVNPLISDCPPPRVLREALKAALRIAPEQELGS